MAPSREGWSRWPPGFASRVARVPWQGREVEVALDSIAGLGDFIELELQASRWEVPQATACLMSLAHERGCENPERRSYLELLIAAGQ
jgi:adenylate cyclase class IV